MTRISDHVPDISPDRFQLYLFTVVVWECHFAMDNLILDINKIN